MRSEHEEARDEECSEMRRGRDRRKGKKKKRRKGNMINSVGSHALSDKRLRFS